MFHKGQFEAYLDQVCGQVRWKKAHPLIRRELFNHMEDHAEAFVSGGMDSGTAELEAVKAMGTPELVGSQLDRSYRPRPAWGIIAMAAVIMAIGFFARMYIVEHIEIHYVQSFHLARSILWQFAAAAALAVGYFVDYTVFAKGSTYITLAFLGTMLVSSGTLGIHSHYSNYLYFLMPVIYAAVLWRFPYKGYGGMLCMYLLSILMMLSNRSVTGFIYGAVCLILLSVCVMNGKFAVKKPVGLLLLYGPAAVFSAWLVTQTSIVARIFRPDLDPLGSGYEGMETQRILAGARLFGMGRATTDAYFLPDAVHSHMLTYFIHRFGWISLIIVLLLFGTLLTLSCVKTGRLKSKLGQMVAGAVTGTFALQCLLYLFNNVFNMFASVTTLPLLSYGNGALIINSLLLGLMLSVFRNDDVVQDPEIAPKRVPRFSIRMEPLQ